MRKFAPKPSASVKNGSRVDMLKPVNEVLR